MPRPSPLVIGHRGAPGYRPEHTRSSYELAIAQGVEAIEPDVVVSRDGVLVVRHDEELSGTTDVAQRPGFAGRRRRLRIDGSPVDGWFAQDFMAEELATLRAREPLGRLRPHSAAFDGDEPVLRLREVLDIAADRGVGAVVELKHPSLVADLGWDLARLLVAELADAGWAGGRHPLVIESFELGVLEQLRATGLRARLVFLLDRHGRPADQDRPSRWFASSRGLESLVGRVDGISVDRRMVLDRPGLVTRAHEQGLDVLAWTCRAENAFLTDPFRRGDDPQAYGDYAGEWAAVRDAGVDGVFVDQPDLGVAVFREQASPDDLTRG